MDIDSSSVRGFLRRFWTEHPYASAAACVGLLTVGGLILAIAILVGVGLIIVGGLTVAPAILAGVGLITAGGFTVVLAILVGALKVIGFVASGVAGGTLLLLFVTSEVH